MKGYNIIYPAMINYAKSENTCIQNELQSQNIDNKVLRFPAGTGSLADKWSYKKSDIEAFIKFCKDSGVKRIVYVITIDRELESREAINKFKEAGLTILMYEYGNEQYLHIKPKSFFEILFPVIRYKNGAKRYIEKFKRNKTYFNDAPISLCSVLPNDKKNKAWDDVIVAADSDYISYHLYGINKNTEKLLQQCPKEACITEYSGIQFGNGLVEQNINHYLTEYHKQQHVAINNMMDRLGDKIFIRMYHSLISSGGYYGRYQECEDKMKDFVWK